MKKRKDTYIQVPLFIFRKAHADFDGFIEYCLAYGTYNHARKTGGIETETMLKAAQELQIKANTALIGRWIQYAERIEAFREQIKDITGKNYPMPNIKVQTLLKYQNLPMYTDKIDLRSRKAIDEFLGYLAVQSMVGKKKALRTNRFLLMARMMGYASYKEIEEIGLDELKEQKPHLYELHARYSNKNTGILDKRRIGTFLKKLVKNWNVLKFGAPQIKMRGFWLGVESNKMTEENFIQTIKDYYARKETKEEKKKNRYEEQQNSLARIFNSTKDERIEERPHGFPF